jgi:thiol-disulfide isomerase/thioredoxin
MAADVKETFYDKAYNFSRINDVVKFTAKIDSIEMSSNQLFSKYDKSKFSKEFLTYIIPTLKYRFIDVRWSYSMYMDSKTYKYVNRELPADYMNFIDKIDINDQEAAGNGRYKVALMRYFYEKLEKDYYKNLTTDIPIEVRSKIGTLHCYNERKKLLKGDVLDFELSLFLRYNIRQINNSNQQFFDSLFKDYLASTKNTEYHNDLIAHFNTINSSSKKYLPKDITLVDNKGNAVKFKDLEGKVLYIDFWATWCAPCLANMNDSKKLSAEFNGNKDIVFVYINVKDSKKNWQKYLDKNNLEGLHLFADEKNSEILYNELYINSIPRYLIVGKNGNIIESVAYTPIHVKESLKKALN